MMDAFFDVSIMKKEQIETVLKYNINKLYIPFDLFYWGLVVLEDIDRIHSFQKQIYISLPRIIRKKDEMYLEAIKELLLKGKADGVLLKNIESVGFIESISSELEQQYISINGKIDGYTTLMIECDYQLYNWNKAALEFNKSFSVKQTVPIELSLHEIKELDDTSMIYPVYGRAALMVSANCVKRTTNNCMADCSHGSFEWKLNDRKNKQFLVYANCIHCYNEIYNSVVTSLHKQYIDIIKAGFNELRIDFTNEENAMIDKILSYYLVDKRKGSFPLSEYTTAHINKGAI